MIRFTVVLGWSLITFFLASCLAVSPKPKGFQEANNKSYLVVTDPFQFTVVGGLAKVHSTISVPGGMYSQTATDAQGNYYVSSAGRLGVKTFFQDSFTGGIYRRNSSPPAYFVFTAPGPGTTEMDLLTQGRFPKVLNQIPAEFIKLIRVQSQG
ncbi:MAG: hypothetical protein M3128_09005 [Verrucomicrobiota bacterium]|nr:hypothetical protein [Verrucomicrobiota bacterium]